MVLVVDKAAGDGAKTVITSTLKSDYFLKLVNFIGQTVNEELSEQRLSAV